jgi:hypothetical protein
MAFEDWMRNLRVETSKSAKAFSGVLAVEKPIFFSHI